MNIKICPDCQFANSATERKCKMCKGVLSGSGEYSKAYSNAYAKTYSPTGSKANAGTSTGWNWKMIIVGVFMLAVSGVLFWALYDLERNGGSIRMPIILIGIYKIAGKWVLSGLFAVVGLVYLGLGFSGKDIDD